MPHPPVCLHCSRFMVERPYGWRCGGCGYEAKAATDSYYIVRQPVEAPDLEADIQQALEVAGVADLHAEDLLARLEGFGQDGEDMRERTFSERQMAIARALRAGCRRQADVAHRLGSKPSRIKENYDATLRKLSRLQALAGQGRAVWIWDAILSMGGRMRGALALHLGLGVSIEEIADHLGVQPGEARDFVIRGLARLREELAAEDVLDVAS